MSPRRPFRACCLTMIAVLAGGLAGCGSSSATHSASTSTPSTSGTASTPASQTPSPLASIAGEATGQPVDGIMCQTQEQVAYHIHAHLAVYVNGVQRIVPEGVGIAPPRQEEQSQEGPFVVAGACFYWLHAHTPDGVIHIESPDQRVFTLGQYFDEWRQPLSRTHVGPAQGRVTVYVDGRPFAGDPRSIQLLAHRQIQLDVGSPVVPPQAFSFPTGL